MYRIKSLISLAIIILFSISCITSVSPELKKATIDNAQFKSYWFDNTAEITHYKLTQARYGEYREGSAVLIFVTEDFLTNKQVKYEQGPYKNVRPVLKLNATRKFLTGVYPYSIMTSLFTPLYINKQNTLKVSFSSQEWCGNSYLQLNRRGGNLKIEQHSYFMNEGDKNIYLPQALLEEELWTKLRLNPDSIPTGNLKIIPAFHFSRLRHIPPALEDASITMAGPDEQGIKTLKLEYTSIERTLKIFFNNQFPYEIEGWQEEYRSGFSKDAEMMTTTGQKVKTIKLDYWRRNSKDDEEYRKLLELE